MINDAVIINIAHRESLCPKPVEGHCASKGAEDMAVFAGNNISLAGKCRCVTVGITGDK
jgi:hypothetical protein